MKWIIRSIAAVVLLVVVVASVGWLLPVSHEASRTADLPAPVEAVYGLVSTVGDYPAWWPEVERVEMLVDEPGQTRFREHMSDGPIVMSVVSRTPPSQFVTRIDDPDQPFGGTWTFAITATTTGSRLTITERGEIYNPIFRALARFVFGYTATLDSFMTAAQRRLASPAPS